MKIVNHLQTIFFLIRNEIKKMYSGSILGSLWFFLNPLLYSFIYFFLFEKVLQIKFQFEVATSNNSNISYFYYLIIGLTLWNSFVNGLLKGTLSLVESAHILKKIKIPHEYFPIVFSSVYALQSFIFLLFLFLLFGEISFPYILLLIFSFLNFFMFLVGLSFLFSALTVYIRDIPQVLSNSLGFIFYSLPIIYPYEKAPIFFKKILHFNPLFYLFQPFYNILFYKEITLQPLVIGFFISSLTLLFGFLIFEKLKIGFTDVL